MPLEAAVLERARKGLGSLGRSHIIKTSGNGEPDLVGSINGFSVVCECKQPGEKPTPLQLTRLRQWHTSGAIALWTDDAETFHRFGIPGLNRGEDYLRVGLADIREWVRR